MSKAEEFKTELGNLRYYLFVGLGLPREDETLKILLDQIEAGVSNSTALSAINHLVSFVLTRKLGAAKADVRAALDRNTIPGEQG